MIANEKRISFSLPDNDLYCFGNIADSYGNEVQTINIL